MELENRHKGHQVEQDGWTGAVVPLHIVNAEGIRGFRSGAIGESWDLGWDAGGGGSSGGGGGGGGGGGWEGTLGEGWEQMKGIFVWEFRGCECRCDDLSWVGAGRCDENGCRETGLDIKRGKARHGTVERRLESPVGVENRRIRYKPPILSGEAHKDRKPQRRQLPRSQCPNFRAPVAPVRRSRGQS